MMKISILKKNDGLATIETLPLLVIFVMLASYMIGFFGVVHTGILNNIAARTYAFETFRNRADLSFVRHDNASDPSQYQEVGFRQHSTADPTPDSNPEHVSTKRYITFGRPPGKRLGKVNDHLTRVHETSGRSRVAVNPVWVMVSYGICMNAKCGE